MTRGRPKTGKSKPRSIRVPDAEWAEWAKRAAAAGFRSIPAWLRWRAEEKDHVEQTRP